MNNFKPTDYKVKCVKCGKVFNEDNHLLSCDETHEPSLLRTEYASRQLAANSTYPGMFSFAQWLPLRRSILNTGIPVSFKSERLASRLSLSNLWIVFSGYWPERKADMRTCTFKELEAPAVCSRLADSGSTLVVASAGNTARAFAEICSINQIPLLLVVPEIGLDSLWSTRQFSNSVRLISVDAGADYFDAINLAETISKLRGYLSEGGAKNIARRDGMGTTVLSAATESRMIPSHYFQAVGSGTGGIAAWEASMRLAADGSFGDNAMTLHLAQNHPFTPMTDAWLAGSSTIADLDEQELRSRISRISSHVLSNRKPPYSIRGGVYDALSATKGHMYSVTNEEAFKASRLFNEEEGDGMGGIDIDPAAAVALASLLQAVEMKRVSKNEMVLLNITGGGKDRLFREHKINMLSPFMRLKREEISPELVKRLFEKEN